MITRADVAGALKVLNSNNTPNRRGWLQNMLLAEHSAKDVAKALGDLESYPEWSKRADLESTGPASAGAAAVASEPAVAVPDVASKRRAPARRKAK